MQTACDLDYFFAWVTTVIISSPSSHSSYYFSMLDLDRFQMARWTSHSLALMSFDRLHVTWLPISML